MLSRQERIRQAFVARAAGMSSEDPDADTWLEDAEVMEALFSFFNGAYYTAHAVAPQLTSDAETVIRARRAQQQKDSIHAQNP